VGSRIVKIVCQVSLLAKIPIAQANESNAPVEWSIAAEMAASGDANARRRLYMIVHARRCHYLFDTPPKMPMLRFPALGGYRGVKFSESKVLLSF